MQYVDSAKLCVTRLWQDGSKEHSQMKEGPRGFALSKFQDDMEWKETEIPIIMFQTLPVKVLRKPAASMKRPAAKHTEELHASAQEDEQ